MNDFDTMMKDAQRLKTAIRLMIDQYKNNKSAINRIHAAFILVDRATSISELSFACENLRTIFKDLNHRELEYEREILDPAQSLGGTSVRHSDPPGDRGRNMDNPNVGPPSVPVQEVATDDPVRTGVDLRRDDSERLARPLQPQQKRHRAKRLSKLRRDDEGSDPSGLIP